MAAGILVITAFKVIALCIILLQSGLFNLGYRAIIVDLIFYLLGFHFVFSLGFAICKFVSHIIFFFGSLILSWKSTREINYFEIND